MHDLKTLVLIALFIAMPHKGAFAAAVTNLTDEPQTIHIAVYDDFSPAVIEPNETWRMQSKVKLRFKQKERWIGEYEEYAIWPDGTFGPQRANMRGGRNF